MSEVACETAGRTRIVTINRPEARNALTRAVITRLREAFDDAAKDDAVRCVVLTGAGGHFCAGADLRQNMMDDPRAPRPPRGVHGRVPRASSERSSAARSRRIAMIDGGAVGFGADLAFACDLRVATPRAYAQEKFVKIGLMPDGGGTFWLPRLVGTARAMR